MGISTVSVSFCDVNFAIKPHSISTAYIKYLDKRMTLATFAGNHGVSVRQVEGTDEYIFKKQNGDFAMGKAVK